MKNFFIWTIILSLSLGAILTSCGGDDNEPEYNPPTSSLNAPLGVSASIESNGVKLSWYPVDNAEFYIVERSSSRYGATVSLGYIGDSGKVYNTSVIDTNPLDGDNYYFIKACNNLRGNSYSVGPESAALYVLYTYNYNPGGGNGENDNQGGNDNTWGGNTQQKPSAPTGVTVSNEGNNYIPDVKIRWNSVSNATSYYIYKSSSANGTYTKIGETSYAQYGYSDSNAPKNGSSAYYKVKAINSAGESPFSDYAKYTSSSNDEAFSPAYQYGECSVSGTNMTLRWRNSTGYGYGKATEVILRVWNPFSGEWQDTKVSTTATSISFNFATKIDDSGYVKAGIVVSNANGSFTAGAKVYDTKNKKWLN